MTIHWDKALNTGVKSIDLQHWELISLIYELGAMCDAGQSTEALNGVWPQLKTYVLFHFSQEENLINMLVADDDFANMHLAQHQQFIAHIDTLQKNRTPQTDSHTVRALVQYLSDWLLHHIATTDHELGHRLLAQHPAFSAQ